MQDPTLFWTDHFVTYGYAVVKDVLDRSYCEEALAEIRRLVDDDRPLNQWDWDKPGEVRTAFFEDPGRDRFASNAVLEKMYDQPRLRAAIDEFLGGPEQWDGVRNLYFFINPFNADVEPGFSNTHHVDFAVPPTPTLYRGCAFMASLVDTEPFGGNMTILPSTHITLQKMLMENPDLDGNDAEVRDAVCAGHMPYEFVAEAGDVLFWHHLVYHSGNSSHGPSRLPRICLVGEAYQEAWLTSIDPDDPNLTPWQRSVAQNGKHTAQRDEARVQRELRAKRLAEMEEEGITVDEKWKLYSTWDG